MHMYATWYNAASSGKAATNPAYGITRSGMPLTKGIVAVDPTVIPLGTQLYIPGLRLRGCRRHGRRDHRRQDRLGLPGWRGS